VESIALMKPKAQNPHETGLLEYLEDIIGTNVYVEHIENWAKKVFPLPRLTRPRSRLVFFADSAAQLEELNEERTEKLNRVRVVEKEKEALEVRCQPLTLRRVPHARACMTALQGAKMEAEEYLQKECEIIDKKAIMYQYMRYERERQVR
jgi:structural maintenance of chromosome 4